MTNGSRQRDTATRYVVMLGTIAPGGIRQVVDNLREAGLFDRYPVLPLVTHEDTGLLRRSTIFLVALIRLFALLWTRRVALVHAHTAMYGSFWRKTIVTWLARAFGCPVLIHMHGSQFEQFHDGCGPRRRAIIRRVLQAVEAVVVLSEHGRNVVERVAPGVKAEVIHNFVNAARIRAECASVGVARAPNRILFLGQVGRRKGVHDLLTALTGVIKSVPDARLTAAGSGEIDGLRRLAADLGVESHVEFPGWVDGRDKIRLLAEATVYALPSYNEGMPVSVLEAMAAGLPVISTPVAGIPEIVRDGSEGLLVPPGAPDKLAAAIILLLRDPEVAKMMGEHAMCRIDSRFVASTELLRLERLYQRLGVRRASTS